MAANVQSVAIQSHIVRFPPRIAYTLTDAFPRSKIKPEGDWAVTSGTTVPVESLIPVALLNLGVVVTHPVGVCCW